MTAHSVFFTSAGTVRAPWRLLFFVAAFIACSFAAAALVSPIVSGAFNALGLRSETFASIVEVVASLAATGLALRWMDRKPWSDVGLDATAAKPMKLGTGFSIGAVAIAAPILLLIVVGWLDRVPATTLDWGHPIVRMTVLLLPAALAEELITRGYILTVLRDALGWTWAVALTSVGFGLLHLQNPGSDATSVVLVALAGVFLAVVRIATGSLYAAWMAHFAWNWVMAAVFHAPVSGFAFDAPVYRYVDAGPDWATGGAWGPEGGVPAGLAMITGTGLLLLRMRRRLSSRA
jgi:membrane protease YdiL (CAAX protease family)